MFGFDRRSESIFSKESIRVLIPKGFCGFCGFIRLVLHGKSADSVDGW